MLYSVQDRWGDVYGTYQVPETNPPLTPEELATRLALEMADYPTAVKVEAAPLLVCNPDGFYTKEDRLVINLEDNEIVFAKALEDVHAALGIITLMNEING